MEKEITVYPNVYLHVWNTLVATCPLDAFPEAVQAYLTDMASAGLV